MEYAKLSVCCQYKNERKCFLTLADGTVVHVHDSLATLLPEIGKDGWAVDEYDGDKFIPWRYSRKTSA